MSTPDGPSGDQGRRAWLRSRRVWVGAALLTAVVALVLGLTLGDDPSTPSATSASAASPSAAPSPSAGPDAAAPSTSPSGPNEVEPGETAGDPTEPAAPALPGEAGEPDAPRPTAEPVPIDAPAAPAPQVEVQLVQIEAVEGEANIPGEVGGPSLRVTVRVRNATAVPLDLTTAVMNIYHGAERSPTIELLEPGRQALPVSVAPGAEATGVYIFLVPMEARGDVLVEFDLSTDATVLLFEGSVA